MVDRSADAGDIGCRRGITVDEAGERVGQRRVGLADRPAEVIRHDAQWRLVDNLCVAAGVGRIVGIARILGHDRVACRRRGVSVLALVALPPESATGEPRSVPSTTNWTVPAGRRAAATDGHGEAHRLAVGRVRQRRAH